MTGSLRTLGRVCIGLFFALAGSRAGAWGVEAHQAIAMAAETALTPTTRQQVERLLAQEPGSTLASISTWADEHRNPTTARWHYVNFPPGSCVYDPARDCEGGSCLIDAATRQVGLLGTESDPQNELTALKYVVHLVGDIHQPLHGGRADDKGGNTFQVQAFRRGTNLHALWDTGLVRRLEPDTDRLAALLSAQIRKPAVMPDTSPGSALVNAAQESCTLVQAAGFYPSHRLDAAYEKFAEPILIDRMSMAATRLGAILNKRYDPVRGSRQ